MFLDNNVPFVVLFLFDPVDLCLCPVGGNASDLLGLFFVVRPLVRVPHSLPAQLFLQTLNLFSMVGANFIQLLVVPLSEDLPFPAYGLLVLPLPAVP